ncbi:MAG: DUF2271 domain-containing protein [Planctomycetes bacterium]|nr:DUF2271 domain-containing protein [Planctomycetota bacterium]
MLGTSFSLTVVGVDEAEATRLEGVVLAEVERLRAIFSTWDAESELSRLNALPWQERKDLPLSPELAHVLKLARLWRLTSGGAFDGYLGALHDLWREAGRSGEAPDPAALQELVDGIKSGVGFRLSKRGDGQVLSCTRAGRFDLGGIAKGYAVNRGIEVLLEAAPDLSGALLELGGDLRVVGACRVDLRAPWVIDVADPRDPADNSPPLARISLRGQAVASSGGYARPLRVGGRARGQILDPKRGEPAEGVLGATAVAGDALTADALATALCVLEPEAGLRLAASTHAECAIVDASGAVHTSPGWAKLLSTGSVEPWPAGYRVELAFELVDSTPEARFKRHGVAAWVEDEAGQRVRLLALWFKRGELKHLKGLDAFWEDAWLGSGGGDDPRALRTWTRASRAPGRYTLAWDGRDDDGRLVPRGSYRVRVDINREKGPPSGRERHTVATLELTCGAAPAEVSADDQPELRAVSATYGPRQ